MQVASNAMLFTIIQHIVDELESVGANDSAERLKDAMAISAMPGEILGELRLTLLDMKRRQQLPAGVMSEASGAIAYLDRVL